MKWFTTINYMYVIVRKACYFVVRRIEVQTGDSKTIFSGNEKECDIFCQQIKDNFGLISSVWYGET